ncbi:bifunctional Ribonuclease H superfamily/DNA-directed DNA polymerase [Babesia duncani]|uniref:Bifunctional Ribonuclease H superfamily/DNA-directed DNA polymerase n=1 Tax=Babesia duncani TaxID=323732 RepID=A0AAD9UMM0_9APIC|nr:bifunctional Ribonuclease H superfamily/DNA-directed DNA polymerase [Babesia duncani]
MQEDDVKVETATETPGSQTIQEPMDMRDGGLLMYLLDISEELGILHLFGRVKVSRDATASCMVTVRNMMRCLFFKVNMDLAFDTEGEPTLDKINGITSEDSNYKRHLMRNFVAEMETLRKEYSIKKMKFKWVTRKLLHFGPPQEENYIKVCYPFANQQISKHHFSGMTYTDVYGSTATATELLLIKRKIKGPSWISIHGAQQVTNPSSTCKIEMEIDSHKNISLFVSSTGTETTPPLCIAAISVKTVFQSANNQEILEISMVSDRSCPIDEVEEFKFTRENQYIGIRRLNTHEWPQQLKPFLEKRPYFRIFEQERGLLANFMKHLEVSFRCCKFCNY